MIERSRTYTRLLNIQHQYTARVAKRSETLEADTDVNADVPWLSDAQLPDWKAFGIMFSVLPPELDAQLKRDAGLNLFEYHVLVRLSEAPDRCLPMSSLAAAAQGSPSRISHAVRRLEEAGWVERHEGCEGRHRVEARLTDAGMQKLVDAAPGHVREVRRLVVDVLTPAQLEALGAASRAILHAIVHAIGPEAVSEVCPDEVTTTPAR